MLWPILLSLAMALSAAPAGNGETKAAFKDDASIVYLGLFSNMEYTEEHAYGSDVELWRQDDRYFGLFSHSEGLAGDTPTGTLDDLKFDPISGNLSFRAKLTTGDHYCKVHDGVPSRDLFKFKGKWAGKQIRGTLKTFDALHPDDEPKVEKTVFKKTRDEDWADLTTYGAWKKWVKDIFEFRGPKW